MLTTLAKVKAWLGETSNAKDTLLESLIKSCSAEISNAVNRNLEQASYTEIIDGNGRNRVTLKNWPISVVLSVNVHGKLFDVLEPADFTSTGVKVSGRCLVCQNVVFEKGLANVIVEYVAGYDPVPEDLDQACVELVTHRFKNERGDKQGVSSKSLAGETISFSHKALPESVRSVLNDYKNVVPV